MTTDGSSIPWRKMNDQNAPSDRIRELHLRQVLVPELVLWWFQIKGGENP